MFQKYYDTNIMTTFVKNLVGSTYIPNIPIWKPDTKIIKPSTTRSEKMNFCGW